MTTNNHRSPALQEAIDKARAVGAAAVAEAQTPRDRMNPLLTVEEAEKQEAERLWGAIYGRAQQTRPSHNEDAAYAAVYGSKQ